VCENFSAHNGIANGDASLLLVVVVSHASRAAYDAIARSLINGLKKTPNAERGPRTSNRRKRS